MVMKLYKFEAPWCQPCKQQKPMLDMLMLNIPTLHVIPVDISLEVNSDFAAANQVRTLTTYLLINDDGSSKKKVGPQSEKIMRDWLGL